MSITYRQDINGLRAFAVVFVLLYHLDLVYFQGGFLGVDIFFVISGYLISKNILLDIENLKFSFYNFYTRRFKRLFPALFFTLFFTLVTGFFILSPINLISTAKSSLASNFWVSNFYFNSLDGYFDIESKFNPLLHIWSLSLEEQYYLIWPIILYVIIKYFRKWIFLILSLLILISLFSAVFFSDSKSTIFYMLQFRFFEFLLGTLVIGIEKYRIKKKILDEILLTMGLSLMIFSIIFFNDKTPMPGFMTLVPLTGAMLSIYSGNASLIGVILRNKVSDFLGKISYSIYLVHWPLIVYFKTWTLSDLSVQNKMLFFVLSIVFGYLSWLFFENSFRNSKLKIKKIDSIWIIMPIMMFIITIMSYFIIINDGFQQRYSKEYVMTREQLEEETSRYWSNADSNLQILKGKETNFKVIVMGDSHAIDLIYALRSNNINANLVNLQSPHYCYGEQANLDENQINTCNENKINNFNNSAWKNADAIYFHTHWPIIDSLELKNLIIKMRILSDAPIYIFGPKMTFLKPVPDIVHGCKSNNTNAINKYAFQFKNDSRIEINTILKHLFKEDYFIKMNVYYIDCLDVQISEDGIYDVVATEKHKFLFFDNSHFTSAGSEEFGKKLKKKYPLLFFEK